jgi:hypothetical protein
MKVKVISFETRNNLAWTNTVAFFLMRQDQESFIGLSNVIKLFPSSTLTRKYYTWLKGLAWDEGTPVNLSSLSVTKREIKIWHLADHLVGDCRVVDRIRIPAINQIQMFHGAVTTNLKTLRVTAIRITIKTRPQHLLSLCSILYAFCTAETGIIDREQQ